MTRLIRSTDKPSGVQPPTDKFSSGEQHYQAPTGLSGRALRAGEKAPGFRLPDQHGHMVTLRALLAKGPVVLRFCRHDGAASCFRELDALAALHAEIVRQRATSAVIAAQPLHPRSADKGPAAHAFLILTDKAAKVARSYGLTYRLRPARRSPATAEDRDESLKHPARNGSAPATYIVDQGSVVVLAFVDLEGRIRMEPDQIVMALECLGKRKDSNGGTPNGRDGEEKL